MDVFHVSQDEEGMDVDGESSLQNSDAEESEADMSENDEEDGEKFDFVIGMRKWRLFKLYTLCFFQELLFSIYCILISFLLLEF